MKHSKRFIAAYKKVDREFEYTLEEAVSKLKTAANAKFDESVEIAIGLGVDPKQADQMIRSTVSLPHGIGKVVRVLALCKEDKAPDAKAAGADYVGLEEYLEKMQGGWLDIDSIIATPDVMPQLGKLGKLLGPRGLMPNPKTGTVTPNIGDAVREIKAGRISFRTDRYGYIQMSVGKASFDAPKLVENIQSVIATIQRLKPSSAKGQYFKKICLSTTMGPGVKLNLSNALAVAK